MTIDEAVLLLIVPAVPRAAIVPSHIISTSTYDDSSLRVFAAHKVTYMYIYILRLFNSTQ